MHLLFCDACKTLEEIPDHDGGTLMVETRDETTGKPTAVQIDLMVEDLVKRHNERDPMAHAGSQIRQSPLRLIEVPTEDWKTKRAKVIETLNEKNKKDGFSSYVSESMNTFSDDALRCYSQHHRPQEGCIDYWSDAKRIGRPTVEGRTVLAESQKLGERDPHLCAFCPVHSWVTTQKNFKLGLYKK